MQWKKKLENGNWKLENEKRNWKISVDFVDFVLALREVFLHGGVIIVQVFFDTIVDKACSAPDVMLVAVVARDLVNSIS